MLISSSFTDEKVKKKMLSDLPSHKIIKWSYMDLEDGVRRKYSDFQYVKIECPVNKLCRHLKGQLSKLLGEILCISVAIVMDNTMARNS